jgi:HEAT repeat protein
MADTLHKIEPLIAALGDVDAGVRRNAAWALGHLADAEAQARRKAAEALGDVDAGVRHVAAWALGQPGDARAVVPLIAAYGLTVSVPNVAVSPPKVSGTRASVWLSYRPNTSV